MIQLVETHDSPQGIFNGTTHSQPPRLPTLHDLSSSQWARYKDRDNVNPGGGRNDFDIEMDLVEPIDVGSYGQRNTSLREKSVKPTDADAASTYDRSDSSSSSPKGPPLSSPKPTAYGQINAQDGRRLEEDKTAHAVLSGPARAPSPLEHNPYPVIARPTTNIISHGGHSLKVGRTQKITATHRGSNISTSTLCGPPNVGDVNLHPAGPRTNHAPNETYGRANLTTAYGRYAKW